MIKWNKHHIELWGKRNFVCALCFFTRDGVRGLFGIIWG